MYNLIPRASCLSDIGRRGLSIIGHLNINSIRNKFEIMSMSVEQYVDILMLPETKFRPGRECRAIACTLACTCHILSSCVIIACPNFV